MWVVPPFPVAHVPVLNFTPINLYRIKTVSLLSEHILLHTWPCLFKYWSPLYIIRSFFEVYIFTLWGVNEPLLFSVIGDAVTIFLYSWYGECVCYNLWFDPGIHSFWFLVSLITVNPAL